MFKRGGTHGVELTNDEHSLKQAQFYNMICVFVAHGVPSQLGQKKIKLFLALDYVHPADEPLALDHKCFELTELIEMPVRTSGLVSKVKQHILDTLKESIGIKDVSRFMLRERAGEDKMTQVYDD